MGKGKRKERGLIAERYEMTRKKKAMVSGSVFVLLLSLFFLSKTYGNIGHGQCGEGNDHAGSLEKAECPLHGSATTEEKDNAIEVGNKVCPVMDVEISEHTKVVHEHEGKLYNLCCPMCVSVFNEDPGKYIEQISGE